MRWPICWWCWAPFRPCCRSPGEGGCAVRLIALVFALTLAAGSAMADGAASLYVFIYRQGPAWQADKPMRAQPAMREHGAYMKKLFASGVSFAAGPTTDTPGGHDNVRAAPLEDAKARRAPEPGD